MEARRSARWCAGCARTGYRYLNVTIPHKLAAARWPQRRGPEVRVSAAANTLLFQRGGVRAENTDGAGLIAALGDLGVSPAGAVIVMAGAGGAAAGALEALTRAGASIRIVARRPAVARALRARLPADRRAQGRDRHLEPRRAGRRARGASALISAVPAAAWADARLRAGVDTLAPDTAVLEMAYGAPTPLAHAVRATTDRYADGLGMLVHQAARAIELALGDVRRSPPVRRRARLTAPLRRPPPRRRLPVPVDVVLDLALVELAHARHGLVGQRRQVARRAVVVDLATGAWRPG